MAVLLFSSVGGLGLKEERYILLVAEGEEAATRLATQWALQQEQICQTGSGEVLERFEGVVDVKECPDEFALDGDIVEVYWRFFDDRGVYEAHCRDFLRGEFGDEEE